MGEDRWSGGEKEILLRFTRVCGSTGSVEMDDTR